MGTKNVVKTQESLITNFLYCKMDFFKDKHGVCFVQNNEHHINVQDCKVINVGDGTQYEIGILVRGKQTSISDIDLVIVGDVAEDQLADRPGDIDVPGDVQGFGGDGFHIAVRGQVADGVVGIIEFDPRTGHERIGAGGNAEVVIARRDVVARRGPDVPGAGLVHVDQQIRVPAPV